MTEKPDIELFVSQSVSTKGTVSDALSEGAAFVSCLVSYSSVHPRSFADLVSAYLQEHTTV